MSIIKNILIEADLDLEHDFVKFAPGFTYKEKLELLLYNAIETGFNPRKTKEGIIIDESKEIETTIFNDK